MLTVVLSLCDLYPKAIACGGNLYPRQAAAAFAHKDPDTQYNGNR
jgi:hypothetical protein